MAHAQSSQTALCLNWLLQGGGPGKLAKAYGLGPGRSQAAVSTGHVAVGAALTVEEGIPDIVCHRMVAALLVTGQTVLFSRGQFPENAES